MLSEFSAHNGILGYPKKNVPLPVKHFDSEPLCLQPRHFRRNQANYRAKEIQGTILFILSLLSQHIRSLLGNRFVETPKIRSRDGVRLSPPDISHCLSYQHSIYAAA